MIKLTIFFNFKMFSKINFCSMIKNNYILHFFKTTLKLHNEYLKKGYIGHLIWWERDVSLFFELTLCLDQEFQNFKEFEMPRIWIALILISFIFQMFCLDKSIQSFFHFKFFIWIGQFDFLHMQNFNFIF